MTDFGNSGERVKTEDGLTVTGSSASGMKVQHRSLLIECGYGEFTGRLEQIFGRFVESMRKGLTPGGAMEALKSMEGEQGAGQGAPGASCRVFGGTDGHDNHLQTRAGCAVRARDHRRLHCYERADERMIDAGPQTLNERNAMATLIKTLAAVAACSVLATSAFGQSAREVRGASPYVTIDNEPAPKLIVDPPLPDMLPRGIAQVQYRAENVHIAPVFGAGALQVSPRVGHLHVRVDDLPWNWVEVSDDNTISVAGLPPGQHKILVELVNPEHHLFAGCAECRQTLTFTVPGAAKDTALKN